MSSRSVSVSPSSIASCAERRICFTARLSRRISITCLGGELTHEYAKAWERVNALAEAYDEDVRCLSIVLATAAFLLVSVPRAARSQPAPTPGPNGEAPPIAPQ